MKMTRTALFPGSFDPFTKGHADIVQRGLTLFDHIIIGVGYNEHKAGFLPVEERVTSLRALYADEPRVSVESYSCLTTDFAAQCGAQAILRGVRTTQDYEYEQSLADVNKRLSPDVETVFLMARPELACCSSSTVRELTHFHHSIADWIPENLHYPSLHKRNQ